VARLK